MKNQKVHFIVGDINTLGGVEKVTEVLSQIFSSNGMEVHIHSIYSKETVPSSKVMAQIHHYCRPLPDHCKSKLAKIILFLNNAVILRIKTKKVFLDGYSIFQGFYLASYLPFLKTNRNKSIVCEHNTYTAPGKISRICRILLYRFFSPILVVLTEADKSYFSSMGIERLFKIYNPGPERLSFPSSKSKRTLIAVGRFTSQKRFDVMVKTLMPLLEKSDWKLTIQGGGEDFNEVHSLVEELKLGAKVQLLPQGNPKALYEEGSIFLMTSAYEGLPMTLLESLSFGIPIVSYNCSPGLAEIISDGQNGFLVEMDDSENFIKKVKLLMDDEELRRKMGHRAWESSTKFSTSSALQQWKQIIQ